MSEELLSKKHIENIKRNSKGLGNITLMEICGGHTNVIMKYNIRSLLPKNIKLISGPGCPVCVSADTDIDCMIALARKGIPIATYSDMMKVPGSSHSLEDIKAKGAKVFEVYSASEVIELKKKNPEIVFFGVGFETTAPMTAYLLENNTCVYSVHKLIPPAIKTLINGEVKIDGFISPGHVSVIIGEKAYEGIKIPQVISGFKPEEILRAISLLVELIKNKKKIIVNGYPEAVTYQGNIKAQKLLDKHFYICDSEWRGLGKIPLSGLEVRNDKLNAKIKYSKILKNISPPKKTACRCGDVIKGLIDPVSCKLYKKVCTPQNPVGACMVSEEGSCAIYYKNDV